MLLPVINLKMKSQNLHHILHHSDEKKQNKKNIEG